MIGKKRQKVRSSNNSKKSVLKKILVAGSAELNWSIIPVTIKTKK